MRGVQVHVRMHNMGHGIPLVLLHGFSGDGRDWSTLADHLAGVRGWYAIDLLGHGKTSAPLDPERYAMSEQVADLQAIFECLELPQIHLLGYSMGGRVALAYAVHDQRRVQALVLESSSPGLRTEEERKARRASDEQLASRIETYGIEPFVDEWEKIPLFTSQQGLPDEVLQRQRAVRHTQTVAGLTGSLRGLGTGTQPAYYGVLNELELPVLLITGERDQKFTGIAREMISFLPRAEHINVQAAGHNVHLERPEIYLQAVRRFFGNL